MLLVDSKALFQQATFLARCVQTTIDEDLPREVGFLEGYDRFATGLSRIVIMPNKETEMLRKLLALRARTVSATSSVCRLRSIRCFPVGP
jgi:hypothetical protein